MAQILSFRPQVPRPRSRDTREIRAEVIIFPGIRVEYHPGWRAPDPRNGIRNGAPENQLSPGPAA
ncbi:hypothetical protein SAMN05216548_11321 [Faunimonas pinastri]|uniref:Uncharacterized protein n=1 Tax=Faunimonas pinastri TaxID=1855383 RepID=A0A1H9MA37_9HYPH|nr:hypothetical protein SAMN05216548_11321 [Faunimonas pinastri]